jgi:hypothetical protein
MARATSSLCHPSNEFGDPQHRLALAYQRVFAHVRAEPLVLGPQRIELQQVLQRDIGNAGNRAQEVRVVLAKWW